MSDRWFKKLDNAYFLFDLFTSYQEPTQSSNQDQSTNQPNQDMECIHVFGVLLLIFILFGLYWYLSS